MASKFERDTDAGYDCVKKPQEGLVELSGRTCVEGNSIFPHWGTEVRLPGMHGEGQAAEKIHLAACG